MTRTRHFIWLVCGLCAAGVTGCLDRTEGVAVARAALEVTPLGCTPVPLRGWAPVHEVTRDAATGRLEVTVWNTVGGMCDRLDGDWSVDGGLVALFYAPPDLACTAAARNVCGDESATAVRLVLTEPLDVLRGVAAPGLAVTLGADGPDFANFVVAKEPSPVDTDVRRTILRVEGLVETSVDATGVGHAAVRASSALDAACGVRSYLQILPDNSAVIPFEEGAGCVQPAGSTPVLRELAFAVSDRGIQPRVLLAREVSGDGFVEIPLTDWSAP